MCFICLVLMLYKFTYIFNSNVLILYKLNNNFHFMVFEGRLTRDLFHAEKGVIVHS